MYSYCGLQYGRRPDGPGQSADEKPLTAELIVGLAATALFEGFPRFFVDLFGARQESVYYTRFAVRCIRLFLCTLSLSCFNKGAVIYVQALGKAWPSTVLSMIREIGFGVGLPLLLPLLWGLDGLLYFMALADILAFFITVPTLQHLSRTLTAAH